MSTLDVFFYAILPYLAMVTFVLGHIWRWRADQFGWTSRSSQLYEGTLLKYGSPLFHYGTLAAIGGHILGILIPKTWVTDVGIPESVYHLVSAYAGTVAGLAVVAGLAILIWRRATNPRVRRVTTRTDVLTYTVMTVVIVIGLAETVGYSLFGFGATFDYRTSVSVWFRDIFAGNPQPSLMLHVPAIYQIHVIISWFFLALFPFSRLVHAWSAPIWYLWRPYIVYRRRASLPAREPGTTRRWQRISPRR
ncbi:MAG: respiratory nitrate reductase subunit gamma [Actinomycetota bacterium]|nr:respiratory nitrate reductase subunit gamma [Actinomycetota bacterium]